jgi:hypothetical protein
VLNGVGLPFGDGASIDADRIGSGGLPGGGGEPTVQQVDLIGYDRAGTVTRR